MKMRFIYNTELNDLRIIICLRKSEAFVERLSVCYVTEKYAEHGLYYLPCSGTNDIIYLLPQQLQVHIDVCDVIETSFCQGTKHNNWLFICCHGNRLWRHLTYNSREAWHTVYAMLALNNK